jgi:hypothetical protein
MRISIDYRKWALSALFYLAILVEHPRTWASFLHGLLLVFSPFLFGSSLAAAWQNRKLCFPIWRQRSCRVWTEAGFILLMPGRSRRSARLLPQNAIGVALALILSGFLFVRRYRATHDRTGNEHAAVLASTALHTACSTRCRANRLHERVPPSRSALYQDNGYLYLTIESSASAADQESLIVRTTVVRKRLVLIFRANEAESASSCF